MTWPDNLVDAIARRKCVLFLGSGISANLCNEEGGNIKQLGKTFYGEF